MYIALCYYKLDFFDVSIEMLDAYLRAHPDSVAAVNLRACNTCRLSNGRNAEQELRSLVQRGVDLRANPILRHNLVVFRDGTDAMQVLPRLLDNVREARSNLVRPCAYGGRERGGGDKRPFPGGAEVMRRSAPGLAARFAPAPRHHTRRPATGCPVALTIPLATARSPPRLYTTFGTSRSGRRRPLWRTSTATTATSAVSAPSYTPSWARWTEPRRTFA